jgi:hypothetical protein
VASKEKKALSPLEKARLARQANKGKAPAKRVAGAKKPGQYFYQAPADFKPHFLEVAVRTDQDGLLGSTIKAIRYVGKYDPKAEDKKKFDLSGFDVPTLIGIQSRLSGATFKTNPLKLMPSSITERNKQEVAKDKDGRILKDKDGNKRMKFLFSNHRLPANTVFYLLFRVGRRSADNVLTVGLKHIQQLVKIDKNGVKKQKRQELDKKDLAYKALAKAKRFMPAAFKEAMQPPKRTRGANKKTEADDE